MKKWMLLVVVALCLPVLGHAAPKDSNLYRGDLSLQTVLGMIQQNNPLPLYISSTGAFNGRNAKDQAIAACNKKINQNPNYWTYYNAAIVHASADQFEGYDVEPYLSERDLANALRYADKAISYYRNNPAKTVYMYLLKGESLYNDSMFWDPYRGIRLRSSAKYARAQQALGNYMTVEKVNPNLAPYDRMAALAKALNKKDLAATYQDQANARQRKAEQESAQRAEQIRRLTRATQARVKQKIEFMRRKFGPFGFLF